MAGKPIAKRHEGVAERYCASCPDVLELAVSGRPELSGKYEVGLDGRIDLGNYGQPRVEGKTPPQIADLLAAELGAPRQTIDVQLAAYRSRHLFLFGQVIGWQRMIPYQGQETVLDVLQRVGGITPTAAPDDVYVVRPHLTEGQRPEVFHVDLKAIVMKHDERSNIRLLPNDQIFVGETRQGRIAKCIPPWLLPAYQAIWDTTPTEATSLPHPPQDQPPAPAPLPNLRQNTRNFR